MSLGTAHARPIPRTEPAPLTEPAPPTEPSEARQPTARAAHLYWSSGCLLLLVILHTVGVDGEIPLALALATWWGARRELSGLIHLHLVSVALAFVIAPRLDLSVTVPGGEQAQVRTYVALWILTGVIAGLVVPRSRRRRPLPVAYAPTGSAPAQGTRTGAGPGGIDAAVLGPLLVAAFLCLLVQASLIAAGAIGVAAQYAGGSSGGGYAGLLGQIGPPLAAGAVLASRAAGHLRWPLGMAATGLLVAHLLLLALTGFRGGGPSLLLVLPFAAAGAAGQPRVRSWPAVAGALAAAMVALFLFGAAIRTQAATQVNARGGIETTVGTGNLTSTVAERLDYVPVLAQAIYLRHDTQARSAVRLSDQVLAATPRFISHHKKPVAYGELVAVAFFGMPPGAPTASTITTLGDGIVNLGLAGALLMLGAYLALLDAVFRHVGGRPTPRNLVVLVILAQMAFDIGSPVILAAIGTVRTLLPALLIVAIVDKLLPVGLLTTRINRGALRKADRPVTTPRRKATDGQPV